MPIAPSKSTGWKGSDSSGALISTGNARLSATLTAVPATHSVIVQTFANKAGVSSGDLVTGVTVGGAAATLVLRVNGNGGSSRNEIGYWIAPNLAAGDKAIVLSVDGPLHCNWNADAWPIATSAALDKTASAAFPSNTATISAPASGATASLAQAVELVIASAMNKFNYAWNGAYGGAGDPPSGYTVLAGLTEDNVNQVGFQVAYKETASVSGVSASWGQVDQADQGALAALATFKISTTQRRLKVLAGSAMNGKTGVSLLAWAGNPKDVLAHEWTGISAEASGGLLYAANPPSAWATGSEVNCVAYQPAGSKEGTSFVVGIVEEY